MKEQVNGKRKKIYYAILAISVLLLTVATVLTVYFVVDGQDNLLDNTPPDTTEPNDPSEPSDPNEPTEPNEPSDGGAVQFCNPVAEVTLLSGYGFYHNQTLGWYYEHEGVDLTAAVGTEVLCMADGTVESVTTDELSGTKIVISHDDGLQTVYCFVTAEEGLKAGDSVEKGEKIATVAEPTGNEYKDGAHLHLEVRVDGETVDPTEYLTLSEK